VSQNRMSTAGTLISELSGGGGGGDADLVQQIFAEMNAPNGNNTMQAPPAFSAPSERQFPPGRAMAASLPPPSAMSQIAMDPQAAQAHMIGGQHPTPADFAHAMYGGGMMPQNPYIQQQQPPQNFMPQPEGNDGLMSKLSLSVGRELKTPLLVALIVLVMSMPFVNTMIGLYLPSLLKMGGDLTTVGLVMKSLLGGALFWILHRIVAPLI
jgi:hypothetical protein